MGVRTGSPSARNTSPLFVTKISSDLTTGEVLGMGTVYLAEQREPIRRRVALKVVKLGMDTAAGADLRAALGALGAR